MEKKSIIDLDIGDDIIQVEVIRSSKRKRSIALQYRNKKIFARVPMKTSNQFITDFIVKKKLWIRKIIKKHKAYTKHKWFDSSEGSIIYFGERISRDKWQEKLSFGVDNETSDAVIKRRYKEYAKVYLTERTYALLEEKRSLVEKERLSFTQSMRRIMTGKKFSVDTVRIWTYRRKYGQCKGFEISYDWRIIAFPKEIIDHIILHELTHLIHKNHKAVFWELLKKLDPDTPKHRQWLRDHGGRIHC